MLCEVLQGLGYDVAILSDYAFWPWGIKVWRGAGETVRAPGGWNGREGPVCSTPEEAIAWIVANVPRPATVTKAP